MPGRKSAARKAALERRKEAHGKGLGPAAQARLAEWLAPHDGKVLAGYMPIRTEIDPLPVMSGWDGPVCVPVVLGKDRSLGFHLWTPGCDLVAGPFGARVPVLADAVRPDVVILPLLAFDRAGGRLGYGGGFYDRTLAVLRAAGPVVAVGFAYSAQEDRDLPLEATDARLDAVVTESEVIAVGS